MNIAVGDPECQHLLKLIGVGEVLSELILAGKSFAIFRSCLGLERAASPRKVRKSQNVRMEKHTQFEECD